MLLLIEDEAPNAAILRRGLEEEGFHVDVALDGITGLRHAQTGEYAAIILDLMLPGMDGWQVCRSLRATRVTTPILILTARGAVEDRVTGLDMGADDYLSKPFAFSELLARVRALLRRDKLHKGRHFSIGDLEVDTASQRVWYNGREIGLAPQEYSLLEALALQEGRVLNRDYILTQVWGNEDSFSNSVDVHIGQLRRKLEAAGSGPLIHTVHRRGYRLQTQDNGPEEHPHGRGERKRP